MQWLKGIELAVLLGAAWAANKFWGPFDRATWLAGALFAALYVLDSRLRAIQDALWDLQHPHDD